MQSKLMGKTLPEIFHDIIFEQITEMNFRDGEFLEQALLDFEETIRDNVKDESSDEKDDIEEELLRAENYIDYLESLLEENEIKYEQ